MQNELVAWQETLRCFNPKEEALKSIIENSELCKIELQTELN
jgi:hypothetical protein